MQLPVISLGKWNIINHIYANKRRFSFLVQYILEGLGILPNLPLSIASTDKPRIL